MRNPLPSKARERKLLTVSIPVHQLILPHIPLIVKVQLLMVRYSFHDDGKRHCKRGHASLEKTLKGLYGLGGVAWPYKPRAVWNAMNNLVSAGVITPSEEGHDLTAEADDQFVAFLAADTGHKTTKAPKVVRTTEVTVEDPVDDILDGLLPTTQTDDSVDWSNIMEEN